MNEHVDERTRRALPLLASATRWGILGELHAAGPLNVGQLDRRLHPLKPRTIRAHRRHLTTLSVLTRAEQGGADRHAIVQLSPRGVTLYRVGRMLSKCLRVRRGWRIESERGESAALAETLVGALRTEVLHRLAERSRRRAYLERVCAGFTANQIDTVLRNLVAVGAIDRLEGREEYTLTRWGRLLVVPVVAATLWDREDLPEGRSLITTDAAASFLMMGLRLIRLRDDDTGACQLTVEADPEAGVIGEAVAIRVVIDGGKVASCERGSAAGATSEARGTPDEWRRTVLERRLGALRITGDEALIDAIVRALHAELILELGIDPHDGGDHGGS